MSGLTLSRFLTLLQSCYICPKAFKNIHLQEDFSKGTNHYLKVDERIVYKKSTNEQAKNN